MERSGWLGGYQNRVDVNMSRDEEDGTQGAEDEGAVSQLDGLCSVFFFELCGEPETHVGGCGG